MCGISITNKGGARKKLQAAQTAHTSVPQIAFMYRSDVQELIKEGIKLNFKPLPPGYSNEIVQCINIQL